MEFTAHLLYHHASGPKHRRIDQRIHQLQAYHAISGIQLVREGKLAREYSRCQTHSTFFISVLKTGV